MKKNNMFSRMFIGQVVKLMDETREAIKRRMQFFAFLSALVYPLAMIMMHLLEKKDLSKLDVSNIIVVILISGIFMFLFKKASNIIILKLSAFLFVLVILIILAVSFISAGVMFPLLLIGYLMVLFSSCLIIPWMPGEVVLVGLIMTVIYTLHFYYAPEHFPEGITFNGGRFEFFQGLIFFFMSLIICFLTRRYSTKEAVEKFNLQKKLEEKNKQMKEELELASRIHTRIIPKSVKTALADIAVTYLPTSFMSGDYAKFYVLDDSKLLFMICDVTGHGVSAALLVNSLNSEFERLVRKTERPGEVLKTLDKVICNDFANTSMYLSAFCGLLDFDKMIFSYSNYGHVPQYLFRVKESEIIKLEAQTSFVGLDVNEDNIHEKSISLEKKDRIFLFTDGVNEARNDVREEYGTNRLETFLKGNRALDVNEFNDKLMREIRIFSDNKLHDDVFILNIQTK